MSKDPCFDSPPHPDVHYIINRSTPVIGTIPAIIVHKGPFLKALLKTAFKQGSIQLLSHT